MARSGAIITNEPSPYSHTMSETPSSATDESGLKRTSDSLECSSGFATSIGSVECELPSAADALTAVNLSSLQGEDGTRPKRPTSAYTVHSTDTGFQGDSEMENQSEAGTAVSPCEEKMMRWSTCSSQDSGAVSESEFQRRNLHPDCCLDCGRTSSPAGKHLPPLRLQVPVSKDPMSAVKKMKRTQIRNSPLTKCKLIGVMTLESEKRPARRAVVRMHGLLRLVQLKNRASEPETEDVNHVGAENCGG
ncbi:hypothetical protein MRX96_038035 [Rhipicephalus microplus]